MSKAAVFSDIEKAFDTTWHSSVLYKLSEMPFSISLIKLIASFLTINMATHNENKYSVTVFASDT
jgi:hypothetical protein